MTSPTVPEGAPLEPTEEQRADADAVRELLAALVAELRERPARHRAWRRWDGLKLACFAVTFSLLVGLVLMVTQTIVDESRSARDRDGELRELVAEIARAHSDTRTRLESHVALYGVNRRLLALERAAGLEAGSAAP